MHLKRIDIHGFKSFADNISIELSDGITAIVGPNGSGKSNVSDAVRWVLGEQSARALRGNKMEDVIFSGAEHRKPLSFCEVSLTFENEDGFLSLPHSEVSVARRVYRSGESEYLINGASCRMKDINTLFYDTGVGRVGYSIIGQGRIEEILSPRGDERRAAFEEAAGVMKYKMRREEAQRKLNSVGKDMQRIDDIVGELELQIEPLREQSEQARKYIEITEELKLLDINIFLGKYDSSVERRERLTQRESDMEKAELASRKRDEDIKHEQSILQEKLELTQQLLSHAREKELAYTSSVQRGVGEMDLLAQRKQHTTEEIARLTAELEAGAAQQEEYRAALENADITDDQALEVYAAQIERLEEAAGQALQAAESSEQDVDKLKQKLMDAVENVSERKARVARMEMIAEQAKQRMGEMQKETETAIAEQQQLVSELDEAKAETDALYQQRDRLAKLTAEGEEQYRALGAQIAEATDKLRAAEQAAQNAAHTLKIQEQLKRDFEGYANSVRNLMRDISHDGTQSQGVYGVVGNLLNVPSEYEKAIELALGGSLQNVVVQEERVAKRLISFLRSRDYGRVTFLPVDALRPRTFSAQERNELRGSGIVGFATDLISYSREISPAVDYLLGRTLVVEDLDSGIEVCRRSRFNFRCVTLQGDIINAGGPITGGSNRERGLVSRDRLIADAKAKQEKATAIAQQEVARVEQLKQQEKQAAEDAQTTRREVYALEAKLAAADERLDATDYQKQRADERVLRYQEELERANGAIQAAQDASVQKQDVDESVDEEALRKEIETASEALAELRERRDKATQQLNEARVEYATMQSEAAASKNNRLRIERDLQKLQNEQAMRQQQLAANEGRIAELETEIAEAQQGQASQQQGSEENRVALEKLETERTELTKQHDAFAAEREQIRQRVEDSVKKRYNIKTQLERLEADFENIQNRIWDDYELSYQTAQQFKRETDLPQASKKAEALRSELHEMGYVNPGSIDEYSRVAERYEFLTTQRDDLEKAKADCEKVIGELTEEMEKRFLTQFRKINECFGRVFKQLFGGGEAELKLQDENNAMESQIDIIARPPGKTLQLISLLSGGERALTAIAILFSMLELKATPFCILDEIEAALDEENLRLFANYLKVYSSKTQFIVITHRRPTMEAAATMYGIAMEEKGVSKLVSVQFQDAG